MTRAEKLGNDASHRRPLAVNVSNVGEADEASERRS
jgi:hypothetical protein